jgi:hypothetical protein
MNHERPRTHKTYHGPDLEEATTFPHITLHLSATPSSKWFFVLGFPNGSPEIAKVETPTTLQDYNFLCEPPIEMRFKAKF